MIRRPVVAESRLCLQGCATLTEMTAAPALAVSRPRNTRPRVSGPNRAHGGQRGRAVGGIIGAQLGVTRQGARQRFERLVDRDVAS